MKTYRNVLLALLVGAAAVAAPPQYISAQGEGEAVVNAANPDHDQAKKDAIKTATANAVRDAVEKAAGVILEADSVTANSQLVRDQVYTHSQGYVHSYKVTSSKVEGEGSPTAKVTIDAEVGRVELDKDLQAIRSLIKRLNGTKIVILLNETAVNPNGTTVSSGTTATILSEAFQKDGWTVLDPAFLSGKVKVTAGVALSQAEVKEIGSLSKADYVLYGTVNFHNAPPDAQFDVGPDGKQGHFVVSGNYELTLFATDSGSELSKIADTFDTGPFDGKSPMQLVSYERTASEIIRLRSGDILGKVRGKVAEALRSSELDGRRLVLTVNGLPNRGMAKEFVGQLQEKWTNAVKDTSNFTFASGKAQLDVRFVGTSDELADTLEGKKFHGHAVEVTGQTGNTLEVTLGK